ncbi:MAG: carbohydrate ABC transporter permease [Thermoprotei archaeon]|nr:MAG: carbohydrate ABC transporter permease [Thermoprotei archaeon]
MYKLLDKIIFYIVLIIVMIAVLFPIYWMLITSFKIEGEIITKKPILIPSRITLEHYSQVIFRLGFFKNLINTAMVSVAAVGISLFVGSFASYALARLKLPENLAYAFLFFVLLVRMLPSGAFVIPLYLILKELKLINTLLGLAIAYQTYTLPYTIWILLGFFKALPRELEEAALVDGASRLRIYRSIIIPMIAPGLVSTAILNFILSWGEYLYALIFLSTPDVTTVSVVIGGMITEYGTLWGQLSAASLMSSLPILAFSFYVQRYIVRSYMMITK